MRWQANTETLSMSGRPPCNSVQGGVLPKRGQPTVGWSRTKRKEEEKKKEKKKKEKEKKKKADLINPN